MSEHFDASAAEMPFLLRFREPGPRPIAITGHYDPVGQRWAHPERPGIPSARSTYPTSHTTTNSTYMNRSSDTTYDTSFDNGYD
ncbi:MAG: hypothetical protein HOV94_11150 [Saccharothrix sp.]|nr:hypothetical protein [Saccharothrix sp.]